MKKIIVFASLFVFSLTMSVNGADKRLSTSVYRASDGRSTTVITNQGAKEESRYIERLNQGGVYKNYRKFTPRNTETIKKTEPQKQFALSSYDVSHIANSHKVLGPIFVALSDGTELDLSPIIMMESKRNNVDPVLIRTIIKYESGFNPYAVSPVGAGGLMQLMPDTARGLGVSDVFSPHQNIAGGTLYIRRQLDNFNNNVAFALASYNAGPGAVRAYGGIPPYAETVNYVNMILADYAKGGRISLKSKKKNAAPLVKEKRHVDVYDALDRMKALTVPQTKAEDSQNMEEQ